MKYKHRRRFHQILRRKQITFDHVKKVLTVAVACIALWVMFFQGTVVTPSRDHEQMSSFSSQEENELSIVSETVFLGFIPYKFLRFLGFIFSLYPLHRLLAWWSYDRSGLIKNVKMINRKGFF